MSADRPERRGVDIVALLAGLIFLAFSIVTATVGVLDLPRLGAAPLWLILIGAGVLLLVSELRGRKSDPDDRDGLGGGASLTGSATHPGPQPSPQQPGSPPADRAP